MSASHQALTRELLVRHLDTWTPTVLHGHRRVSYAEAHPHPDPDGSTVAALRVFGEFSDLLERHQLFMVLAAAPAEKQQMVAELSRLAAGYGPPVGLHIHAGSGSDLVAALRETDAFGSPIMAFVDGYTGELPSPAAVAAMVTANGRGRSNQNELLLVLPAAPVAAQEYPHALADAGLARHCLVELVDAGGQAQLVIFATASTHSLERFKDELWALDEYGGIRYRDPRDPAHALLDITLEPHLGPLRRMIGTQLAVSARTMSQLRAYVLNETIYRAGDAGRAVHSLIDAGLALRTPARGRLTAETVITPR